MTQHLAERGYALRDSHALYLPNTERILDE